LRKELNHHLDVKNAESRKVKLNCTSSRDAFPDWNHWRASCIIEASDILPKLCAPQAKQAELDVAQTKLGRGEVRNKGESCHTQCGGEPGACGEFCGPGGTCCRRAFLDAVDEPDCGYGTVGCDDSHCCLAISDAYSHPAAISITLLRNQSAGEAAETLHISEESLQKLHLPWLESRGKEEEEGEDDDDDDDEDKPKPYSGNLCAQGLLGGDGLWPMCCPKNCTVCGGIGCTNREAGFEMCCSSGIVKSKKRCLKPDDVACAIPPNDPFTAMEFYVETVEAIEELSHLGESCHSECGSEPGVCNFCGPSGACCRRAYEVDKDERACGLGALGCPGQHCCVPAAKQSGKDNARVLHMGANCHGQCDGISGPCLEFCGGAGACCRLGFEDAKDQRTCGFGSIGCDGFHCCVASAE